MLILEKLKISNFAIIESIEVDFTQGFNVITGETGAGKSIVINALNLALGYKADISKIRSGASDSEIEAVFKISSTLSPQLLKLLKENEIPIDDDYLVYKRKLYDTGRSSAWINRKPCSINLLKSAGGYIVDMHGQHAHQQLLDSETHIGYLDSYGDYKILKKEIEYHWDQLSNANEKLKNLLDRQKLNNEKRELWQFQFDEISKINPLPGEIEDLENEQNLLENSERYHQLANSLTDVIYEGDDTLYNNLQSIINQVRELNKINPEFDHYLESLDQTKYLFQELSGDISNSAMNVESNPTRLEEVNNRLFDINKLQKKYGSEIEDIIAYKNDLDNNLNIDGSLEIDIKKVRKEIHQIREKYSELVVKLSGKRQQAAKQFEKAIVVRLTKLGFKDSYFLVKFSKMESSKGLVLIEGKNYYSDANGMDRVEFYIRTNIGEPLSPLVETVSGGEVSRIMLAMKSILASGDQIPVLIFDEIDTGISGHIARIVGEEMLNLSQNHQILCITHLPQIASLGNHHLAVKKKIVDQRSITYIEDLKKIDRIEEIAKLIGGKEITDSGLNQARELMELQ